MTRLSISFFGTFAVTRDDQAVKQFGTEKIKALCAYLALEQGRSHQRSALVGLLWPDSPEAAARHSLSQSLWVLRQALSDDPKMPFILAGRQEVRFNPASDHWIDVMAFGALIEACELHRHADGAACRPCMDRLAQAVELYRGPLLDQFMVVDSAPFEEWLAFKREQYHRMVVTALQRLVRYYEQGGLLDAAIAVLRRHLAVEPWQESVYVHLMQLLARAGDRSGALVIYARCREAIQNAFGIEPAAETTALYHSLAGRTTAVRKDMPAPSWEALAVAINGDIPDTGSFYGRRDELATLERWIEVDRCRVVALVGMGGIGKTTLAARLTTSIADQFDYVVWRSLLNAPPLDGVLHGWIETLSDQQRSMLPPNLDDRLQLLLGYLRERRCLLVLDNLESILLPGERAGTYRPGYEDYGQLIQRIAQTQHQSCLLLTSRERSVELARREGETTPVRSLQLGGVAPDAGQAILQERGLLDPPGAFFALVTRYAGNPLALQLVGDTIRDVFAGDAAAFLRDEPLIFDDIRDVLDQHFARLSALEREIMTWLAIEREAVTVEMLEGNLLRREPRRLVVEAIRSLRRRSLLEQDGAGFYLQNVVMEYTTDHLITQILHELETERLELWARHALIKAQAKEYVRQSQIRLILAPIAATLVARLGLTGVDATLRRVLGTVRVDAALAQSYAAGNVLNLLLHIGQDLEGYDFSGLAVRQADLRGKDLPGVNFAGSALAGSVFTDNFRNVLAVAWSPDGQLVAGSTTDGVIRLWRVVDGQVVSVFKGHGGYIESIAFSPDGRLLASSGGEDLTVRVWNVRTGEEVRVLRGHRQFVSSVAWSPDGATLASGGEDQRVCLWDLDTGQTLHTLRGHGNLISSIAFSPDGATLASGSWDRTVRLWRVDTGATVGVLEGHSRPVASIAFSPDGTTLASGSWDQTIRLWSVDRGDVIGSLSGHTQPVLNVTWSPDGATLASGSDDRTVRLWDVHTAQPLRVLHGHDHMVSSVAFDPDGAMLVSGGGDKTVRLWNVHTGRELRTLRGYTSWLMSIVFSANGSLLVGGNVDLKVRIWRAQVAPKHSQPDHAMTTTEDHGRCKVERARLLHTLPGHTSVLATVAFSADGRLLASGSWDQSVRVWDVRTGQTRHILHGHHQHVACVAFAPDGITLASAGWDQTVRVWDAENGAAIHTLHGHLDRVIALAFSPADRLLASGGWDQTVRVWDLRTGAAIYNLQGHTQNVVAVAFSPDGSTLASGGLDETVRLWNLNTGTALHVLQGHALDIHALAFSPDGKLVVSGGVDQTVRVWHAQSGELLHTLTGHTGWVRTLAFSPDGMLLASGSDDETLRAWDVATGRCLQMVRAPQPYAGMNIAGVTGLTPAQLAALKALGAVEDTEQG